MSVSEFTPFGYKRSPEKGSDLPKATQQAKPKSFTHSLIHSLTWQIVLEFAKGGLSPSGRTFLEEVLACAKVRKRRPIMVKGVGAAAGPWGQILALPLLCDLEQVSELLCASVSSPIG